MSIKQFMSEDLKKKCADIVQDIESKTSAEIVIAVRSASDSYEDASWFGGCVLAALTAFVAFILDAFAILELSATTPVLAMLIAFILGKVLVRMVPALTRACIPQRQMMESLAVRAKARFIDLGMSRTSGRNGILFYVSLLERRVYVLPDIGVDEELLGEPWAKLKDDLDKSIAGLDLDAFEATMKKAGPILGAAMPRSEDDVNELPDMMQE